MKKLISFSLSLLFCVGLYAEKATVRIDAQQKHQYVTGFGGFVCSPQFQYSHMSTADIKRVWGKSSTVGCNIMRLYIPIGKNAWSQSLATAQTAKSLGLIVFASPWGQPAEWKTNNSSNAKNENGEEGYLKKEKWADYAQYLEDYVQYLRTNGVKLDAISIQNEPDWPCSYAGCLWSAADIAEFVKTYGSQISCKVIAPETLAISDSYANALNKTDVLDCFDIYGGHQYGGIQSAYKNLGKKGKELWMTEYLINWNENQSTSRNFDFSKDFFDFFRAINVCMLGDFNAWIHYAAKRYYGMLGDGQCGTTSGVVTKRGYVMAHFARYVTGMTRIDATFGGGLEGSAYLSQTGDTVVCVMANSGGDAKETVVDLPFYTVAGKQYTTTKTSNLAVKTLTLTDETCRPVITVAAQSVMTVLFVRSRDRQPSNMTGTAVRFDRLDDMTTTKSSFGTTYKISGKSKTFDSTNPLISSRTNTTYGYVALNERYAELVMHIKKVTTTGNYTAGNTTLTYVNAKGSVATHNYDRMDLSKQENFDLVFDLSPATLTDGCIGLLSLTCDNSYSHLTLNFGDVFLRGAGSQYAGTLKGAYVADDSNVLDYSSDASCTSIDMTGVTDLPSSLPWLNNSNRVVYMPEGSPIVGSNIVSGGNCSLLSLDVQQGDFRPVRKFTATEASLALHVDGMRFVMLPFNASVPEGVKARKITEQMTFEPVETITAHQPVLLIANGDVVLKGTGDVEFKSSALTATQRGSYISIPLYAGDYIVGSHDGEWGLVRVTSTSVLSPFDVYVKKSSTAAFLPFDFAGTGISELTTDTERHGSKAYNLMGQPVGVNHKGLVIVNGKKLIRR